MLDKSSIITLFISLFLTSSGIAETVPLKQKIGQMLMVGFSGATLSADDPIIKAIEAQHLGGVILFDYDFKTKTYHHNIENPTQLKALTTRLQSTSKTPLLIAIDYEGGKVNRLKSSYGFKETLSAQQIAEKGDEAAEQQAIEMATTLHQMGINLNFAPVVDINLNPNNPIIGRLERSFSTDAKQVAHFAKIFSDALYDQHILCAYKHFPGHGSSNQDSHVGFVDITHTWQPQELTPYKTLWSLPKHCPMVMVAHIVHHGLDKKNYPASLSKSMMTGLLRHSLHYNGVIISDDLQMKAISDQYSTQQAARLAIQAGVDILVFGNQLVPNPVDPETIVESIYQDVLSGKIKHSQINAAYHRIMRLKKQLNLPLNPPA